MGVLMAARLSGLRKHRTKVVLALAGGGRRAFEQGDAEAVARRAAALAKYLDPAGVPDVWLYAAECHRLPEMDRTETWIREWTVLRKRQILPGDRPPGNALERKAGELFSRYGVAGAMRTLAEEYGDSPVPVLVLFHVQGVDDEDAVIAGELEKAAEKPLFWQFFASLDTTLPSVLDHLAQLREERPQIRNAHYNDSWDLGSTPVLEPFMRYAWIRHYARWRRTL